MQLDPDRPEDFEEAGGPFDTVLCVNVLEYVADPGVLLDSAAGVLKSGGSIIILAPQNPALFSTLDTTLGHLRRFSKPDLQTLLEQHGFTVKSMFQLNKIGTPGWWLYGKILGRRHIGKVSLKLFDKTVWFWRHMDGVMPWKGLSLVVVATKRG